MIWDFHLSGKLFSWPVQVSAANIFLHNEVKHGDVTLELGQGITVVVLIIMELHFRSVYVTTHKYQVWIFCAETKSNIKM